MYTTHEGTSHQADCSCSGRFRFTSAFGVECRLGSCTSCSGWFLPLPLSQGSGDGGYGNGQSARVKRIFVPC